MKRICFFLILFFLNGFQILNAQFTERPCGVKGTSQWFQWYAEHREELIQERSDDSTYLTVPVTVFIVGNTSGTGYWTASNVFRAICEMNQQFTEAKIRFYLYPGDAIRYLNNSAWYNHDWAGGQEMAVENRIPGRLNAFVVNDPAGNCGYSGYNVIVLKKTCSNAGNSTWSHEAGHHFSLPHPFSGWEDMEWDFSKPAPLDMDGHEVERVDGTNCLTAGDRLCDTKPDYLSDRWNCNPSGESPQQQLDPDSISFRSDGTLFMSYANDACANRFSPDQITAMRTNLIVERESYLPFTPAGEELPDSLPVKLIAPLDTAAVQYNNFVANWHPVPGAKYYSFEASLNPSFPNIFISQIITLDTSFVYTASLPKNRFFYWRVYPFNDWDVCRIESGVQVGVFFTTDLTAVQDWNLDANARIIPSPAITGMPVQLDFEISEAQQAQLTVVDMTGKVMVSRSVYLNSGSNSLVLSEGVQFQPGLYQVKVQGIKGVLNSSFAIIR